jgi:hypothetical protein
MHHVYPPDGLRRSAENAGTVPRVFVMIEPAITRPQDVPCEILTELGINPSAGRFEGLLDASTCPKTVAF